MNNIDYRQNSNGNCPPISKSFCPSGNEGTGGELVRGESVIMGIDPGSNVMGYGVIRCVGKQAEMVAMGVIDMRKESDPFLKLLLLRLTDILLDVLIQEILLVVLPRKIRHFLGQRLFVFIYYRFLKQHSLYRFKDNAKVINSERNAKKMGISFHSH